MSLSNIATVTHQGRACFTSAFIFICAVGLFAQEVAEPLRPSFWKEYARHNWLASLSNDFDSTQVEWSYGEVRIDYPNDTQFVFLELTQQEFFSGGWCCSNRGIGLQGADVSLGESARTRPFTYKEGAEVAFVRFVESYTQASVHLTDSHEPKARLWRDFFCLTKPDEVRDTVDVVLELVDAASRQRLVVLDSIRILARPGKMILERTGTEPDKSVRRLRLPTEYAGRAVYVRPLPYRWGPSPYGLLQKKMQNENNLAHLLYDEHRTSLKNLHRTFRHPTWYPDGTTPYDTVEASTRAEYLRFLRVNYQRDSCLPPLFYRAGVVGLTSDDIKAEIAAMNLLRYSSTCYQSTQADTAWIVSTLLPTSLEKEALAGSSPTSIRPSLNLTWDGTTIRVALHGTKSARNKFIAYDIAGAELFRGTFPPAPFDGIELPVPNSARGNIFIRCILADGIEVNGLVSRGS